MDDLSRVTDPPKHHFFGYYEKSPWNGDESLLLTHETSFQDRRPTAADAAGICVIDDQTNECNRVAETYAWDFQQGAMLQWLGPSYDRKFIFNDRGDHGFVARMYDVDTDRIQTVDHPVYAVTSDGRTGFTLDYARLDYTRPGYGYAPVDDRAEPEPHAHDEGVYRVDLNDGSSELLVSLSTLATFDPVHSHRYGMHWVNHIQLSPHDEQVAFIHRSETPDDRRWLDRLFVMKPDGSNLQLLHSGFVSHYDWRTDEELLAWTDHNGTAFYRYHMDGSVDSMNRGVLPPDGHCSFSPDGEWLLLDSFPDERRHRGLFIYQWERAELINLASVYSPPVELSSLRCDLHPRWDRSGKRICFDSTHEGSRQLYVLDLADHVA